MAKFPRLPGALPRLATPPRFPSAMQSWGATGKGQIRAVQNMGRVWTEIYPLLDCANPNVRALIETLNRSLRSGILWEIQHPYWHRRSGVGGGVPLVDGSSQTGSTINIKGATPNVSKWLRQGDLIGIGDSPVLYDVTSDIDSGSTGKAAVTISPPIFTGRAPANSAVVTIDPSLLYFNAYIIDIPDFPQMDSTRYIDAGLAVTWREQVL